MGAYAADTDSEQFDEKAQITAAPKQSYCPFVLFRQYRRDRRARREQKRLPEIEKIREQINESRKKLKRCQEVPWQRTTSTEGRRKLWEHGVNSASFIKAGSIYSKGRKYRLSWTGARGLASVIHDLRTPEGCEEAFKWWDKEHTRREKDIAYYSSKCDSWEALYERYIKEYDPSTRDLLLKGDPTRWTRFKVEVLPN